MLDLKIVKTVGKRKRPFTLNAAFNIDQKNSTTVFFGASGSGKTMTLQCMAGLIKPDCGFIKYDGRMLYDSESRINVAPQKRKIGYMPQDFGLFPHLNLLENVAYADSGITGKFLSHAQKEKARNLLSLFDLLHLEKNLPGELSGGQKQRASLARALNASPSLLLLDEPFSSLDPLLRAQMRGQLVNFIKELSLPLIVITHDPDDVEVFGQTVVLFSRGEARTISNFREESGKYATMAECLLSLQQKLGI